MSNLFNLKQSYLFLKEMMLDPGVDTEAVQGTLESLAGAIEEKADGYAYIISEIEAQQELIKSEIARLFDLSRVIENKKEAMKQNLLTAMVATENTKFKTPFHSFGIGLNKFIYIQDETVLDSDYIVEKVTRAADKKKIKEAIESGVKVKGAIINERPSLQIR